MLGLEDDFPVMGVKLSRLLHQSRSLSLLGPMYPEWWCTGELKYSIDTNIHRAARQLESQ
jgi:hypothetical protein